MPFALADLNEVIANVAGDRDAIIAGKRRITWEDFRLRTRRLGNLLIEAGLGCQKERDGLLPWESGQDHLALYLYNDNAYLEGMIGSYKARVAPFNVNYRYVEAELAYLLKDAQTRAILYHASFAPRLAHVLPELPDVALLLQVDDGSGEPLLPGARDYEQALGESSDELPAVKPTQDDLYILYTGGTTGVPKGVLWRQEDIFFAALGGHPPGMPKVTSVEELVDRAKDGGFFRMLPAPPFMHNAAHWSSFIALHSGGTVILPENARRLDPDDIWRTIEREQVFSLTIVGDAFARPLLDQLRKGKYDLSCLQILGSGGAVLSQPLKQGLLEALPHATLFDGYGSSETGAQGTTISSSGAELPSNFNTDDHTVVLNEALTRRLEPGEDEIGWLARRGHVPLGYLGDEAKTRRTYPTIGGVRYSVPGDRAQPASDGTMRIFGRDSVCINTGGEKVFAEEVEEALKHHSAVYDAVVTGTPSERWGEQVTAVVSLRPDVKVTAEDLRETAAAKISRYKLPKAVVFVDEVVRSPTGKPDYRWARNTAIAGLEEQGRKREMSL